MRKIKDSEKSTRLTEVLQSLNELAEDTSVPRNIRKIASTVKEKLLNEKESLDIRVASAIYILDEIVNDTNLPVHGRTLIWNIISQLEPLK